MTTVHEFYEHLDALYEKGDAAGVEAYLTGIANSTGSLSNFGVLKCLCTPGEDMH